MGGGTGDERGPWDSLTSYGILLHIRPDSMSYPGIRLTHKITLINSSKASREGKGDPLRNIKTILVKVSI